MARNQVNPPPLRTISDFKSKLTGGSARANLFEVVLTFPDLAQPPTDVLDKSRFLVFKYALPNSMVRSGETLRSYRFYDIFPTQVAPIELSYDSAGIQEFTVELQVQWWEAVKGTGANAGGEDIN